MERCVSLEKERGNVWKDCMEGIMNEEESMSEIPRWICNAS